MAAPLVHTCCNGPVLMAPGMATRAPATRPPVPSEHLPAIDFEQYPGAATALPLREYQRHEPEKTVLYAIVQEHLETFLARPWLHGGPGYPRFVEEEFRRYLDCGILSRGFSRIRCPACGFERIVALSCKGRAVCPSCTARRTNDTAARLVDHLLPAVPYRQWVLSFPFPLRFSLARNPDLFGKMVSTFLGIVFSWQRHQGRLLGVPDGQTGAVTFLQRFGGALNCNPHAHCVLPDGLLVPPPSGTGPLSFVPLPSPTDEDVALLTQRIARRLIALARRTLGEDGEELFDDDDEEQAVLRHDLASALTPPSGGQTTLLPAVGCSPTSGKPLSAVVDGFSLHAARTVDEDDRDGLERLCRYGLRSPFSQERLSLLPDGRVVYKLAKPWPTPTGRTELVLDPIDFLRRLAVLIPAPYSNMVRYHGVFANRSRYRSRLPPPPPSPWLEKLDEPAPGWDSPSGDPDAANQDPESTPAHPLPDWMRPPAHSPRRPSRIPWAALLRRVFDVDALTCPRCFTPMVVLAFITDTRAITRILDHLGLPTSPPPLAPPRLPTQDGEVPLDEEPTWEDDDIPTCSRRSEVPPAPS